jgi:broad specificity phosphatase PhoE
MIYITMKIILIRHGESTENVATKEGKTYDAKDIKLTSTGIKQTKETANYLYKLYGRDISLIYTSPVKRCIQTTELINSKFNVKVIPSNLLIEIGGISNPLDGLSSKDEMKIIDSHVGKIRKELEKKKDPFEKYVLMDKMAEILDRDVKGVVPNLEGISINCKKFLNEMKKNNASKHGIILVITHGGVINMIQRLLCNINIRIARFHFSTEPFANKSELAGNCCLAYLLFDKKYHLIEPANTRHLNK